MLIRTRPWHLLSLWTHLLWIFHRNGIIYCSFRVWPSSLSKTFSRFSHTCAGPDKDSLLDQSIFRLPWPFPLSQLMDVCVCPCRGQCWVPLWAWAPPPSLSVSLIWGIALPISPPAASEHVVFVSYHQHPRSSNLLPPHLTLLGFFFKSLLGC